MKITVRRSIPHETYIDMEIKDFKPYICFDTGNLTKETCHYICKRKDGSLFYDSEYYGGEIKRRIQALNGK